MYLVYVPNNCGLDRYSFDTLDLIINKINFQFWTGRINNSFLLQSHWINMWVLLSSVIVCASVQRLDIHSSYRKTLTFKLYYSSDLSWRLKLKHSKIELRFRFFFCRMTMTRLISLWLIEHQKTYEKKVTEK